MILDTRSRAIALARGRQRVDRAQVEEQCRGLAEDTFPESRAFIEDPSDRVLVGLARRGGKTTSWLRRQLIRMLRRPGYAVPVFATKKNQAKEIVHAPLLALAERYNLSLHVNFSELRYTLPNGSHMFLAGLNDASQVNKARGSPYDAIVVTEAQSVRTDLEEFIQSVANPALMDRRGEIVLDGTPDPHRLNKFWANALIGEDKRWSRHWWPVTANPFIQDPAAYLKRMLEQEGYTEDDPRFRAEFLGDVNAFDAAMVMLGDFLWARNWLPALPKGGYHYYAGQDIGLVDKAAWCVWAASWDRKEAYLVHSYHRSGMDITEQGEQMVKLAERFKPITFKVDEGALGKLIALELSNRIEGLTIEAAAKSDKALQVKLMNTDFRRKRAFLVGTDHVLDKKTNRPAVAEQWERTMWDENHQREADGQEVDLLDAALYGWRACKTYFDSKSPDPNEDEWEQKITQHDAVGRFRVQHFNRK